VIVQFADGALMRIEWPTEEMLIPSCDFFALTAHHLSLVYSLFTANSTFNFSFLYLI
jgi:hypothetical protein